jgi:hypothetical protein
MARRSVPEEDLGALLARTGEIASSAGILAAPRSGFDALAAELIKQEARRRFPPRDHAALAVTAGAAEARRTEARAHADTLAAVVSAAVPLATVAISAGGLLMAGAGVAIALPAGPLPRVALGLALAVAALLVVALKWGAAHATRRYAASLALRRASRAAEKAKVQVSAARHEEQERTRWIFDTTRLLRAHYDFHRHEAELAVAATLEQAPDRDDVKTSRPH